MMTWKNQNRAVCEANSRRNASSLRERAFAPARVERRGQITRHELRLANNYFTKIYPCSAKFLLLKTSNEAARDATSGDIVLLARPFSSFGKFRNHQNRSEVLYQSAQSIGWGMRRHDPNINGKIERVRPRPTGPALNFYEFASGFFEEKPRRETKRKQQQLN